MPLRSLPKLDQRMAWPTLSLTNAERQEYATPPPTMPPAAQARPAASPSGAGRGAGAAAPPATERAWLSATVKGAVLGLGLFGLFYGYYPNQVFWLAQWRWAYLLGGIVLATILIRFDRTLVLLAGAGLWFSRDVIIHHPQLFGLWILGGIVARLFFEALP